MVSYQYDSNGNVASVTPPGRPVHTFSYTPVDMESEYLPPDVGFPPAIPYSYNADRQLTKITRPDGQAIDLNYDTAGKLISITPPPRRGRAGWGVAYSYNPATGNLETITAPDGGTLNYTWDGFLLTGTTWIGAITGSVTRTHNADLQVSNLTVNGDTISLAYDADSLLTQTGSLTIARDSQNGLVTDTVLGSITTSQAYSTFGEVSQFTASYGGSALLDVQYTRDNLGRVTGKTETVEGETHTYVYTFDPAGRLTEVKKDGAVVSQYTYDSNSNRVGAQRLCALVLRHGHIRSAGPAPLSHLLPLGGEGWVGVTYTYTANGELQSKADTATSQTTVFEYDLLGNLRSVVLSDNTLIEYLIDGRNRRIGKKVNGVLTQGFLYQDQLKPIAELDASGNVTARFVYGSKANVPEYMVKGGQTYRIITDHLGSPRLVVNASDGSVAQRMDYDEFGNVLQDTNPGFQPFAFAGGLYDSQTKLTRFGARDYDPEVGRWTAKDPIGFAGGDVNLYGYVLCMIR